MQSPLFANTENQSEDRYALQNHQLLRVRLVQPSEQMPPQHAQIGQGLAAQFGAGQHGSRAYNQGNIFGT